MELATRVALVSASANHEDEVTDACITAAIHFTEWQYRVRQKYGPGEPLNQDAQVPAAILDAFLDEYQNSGRHELLKWRTLANNKNFARQFGSMTNRSGDAPIAGSHLEAEFRKNSKPQATTIVSLWRNRHLADTGSAGLQMLSNGLLPRYYRFRP